MTAVANEGRWATVPLEIAKRHALYGVGGWLWLVVLGNVISPIRIALSLGPLYSSIDYANLHPRLAAFIYGEIVFNAIVVLWSVANLFLLFSKHRLFPRSLVGLLAFSSVFVPLDAFVARWVTDSIGQAMPWEEVFDTDTVREIGRSIVGAAIWIPYALMSRRVNVTYLNRVRADDPLLRENAAEVF
jgi:hypothetical protein